MYYVSRQNDDHLPRIKYHLIDGYTFFFFFARGLLFRRGGGGPRDSDGRYKGQSLSGEKQLSVSEAVRTLVGHVFRLYRPGDAGGPDRARPAGVLGLG